MRKYYIRHEGRVSGLKVSALVADNEEIIGWMIVKVYDDGTIKPTSDRKFKSLKELFNEYLP